MVLDWSTLALQTINFAVLVWLLRRFLYRPVLEMIDRRRDEVERELGAARAARDKAQEERAAIAADRAGIAAERDAALQAAAGQALAAAEARHAQAEHEAQAIVEAARKALAAERDQTAAALRGEALDLAATLAARLLDEIPAPLRAEASIERIEQHLAALSQVERAALTGGSALTVVTAIPLPPAMSTDWRARLGRLLGDGVTIDFAVDPVIGGGAELHFPTSILRFSLQSTLAAVREEMGAHADAG